MPNTANISISTWERVKNKRGFWLMPFLGAFFVMVSFVLVLVPQMQAISNGRRDLAKDKATLKQLAEKRQYLLTLSSDQLDEQYQLASSVLPNSKPVFQAVGILMQQTAGANVSLSGYDLSPGEVGTTSAKDNKEDFSGKLAKTPVEFTATGTFEDLYSLLTNFELTAPLSRIVGIDLTGFADKTSSGQKPEVSAKMSAEIYYAPPPKTLGKATSPLIPLNATQQELLGSLTKYKTLEALDKDVVPGFDEQKTNPFSF
jgi:hypothetical protein